MPVFKLSRKRNKLKNRDNCRISEISRRRIVDVVECESVLVKCISVDNDSHLFLCGEHNIPTHNTQLILLVLAYFSSNDPCNILLAMPSTDMAKGISKERIKPMILANPEMKRVYYTQQEDGRRSSTDNILNKQFLGGTLTNPRR